MENFFFFNMQISRSLLLKTPGFVSYLATVVRDKSTD